MSEQSETKKKRRETSDGETAYAKKRAELVARRAPALKVDEAARRERDVNELDAVYEKLEEIDGSFEDNVIRVPDAPPEMVGHLVLKRPEPSATAQFKSRLLAGTKLDADRGASARRVDANKVYVLNCLAYPTPAQFDELVTFAPGLPESAVKLVHRLAEAGAQDDSKE